MKMHTENISYMPSQTFSVLAYVRLPGGSVVKNPPANIGATGDMGSIPVSGRSPGGGNGNPLQYSPWEVLWTEGPGKLQSMGSQRVRHG